MPQSTMKLKKDQSYYITIKNDNAPEINMVSKFRYISTKTQDVHDKGEYWLFTGHDAFLVLPIDKLIKHEEPNAVIKIPQLTFEL